VSDASASKLWQQVCDFEEMPGARLTFTTAANTPDAIALLAGRPIAERLVFHAACGRLHVWPSPEEAPALAKELAGLGFALIGTRGLGSVAPSDGASVSALRAALRRSLDPRRTFALGQPRD
jgi:hypothetical protein